jgi:hypothetical protein
MRMPRKLSALIAFAVVTLVAQVGAASAQVRVDPAVPSERNDGGWIYWLAILFGALALIAVIRLTIKYMRYAPRFSQDEANLKVVRADRVQLGRELPRRNVDLSQAAPVVVAPPALPTTAPALASVAAPQAPAAAAAAQGAAPEAAAPSEASAEAATAEAETAPAPAAAPAPAPAPAEERPEVTLDQEAYEAALKELLDAGTDRRIAEGKAKRAGMIAARKKATGQA